MPVVKEYFVEQIEMKGPGNWNAKPADLGTVCLLRFDDRKELSLPKLAALFNVAAADYPEMPTKYVKVLADHIEYHAKPKADYKPLPPKTIGARG